MEGNGNTITWKYCYTYQGVGFNKCLQFNNTSAPVIAGTTVKTFPEQLSNTWVQSAIHIELGQQFMLEGIVLYETNMSLPYLETENNQWLLFHDLSFTHSINLEGETPND